MSELLVAAVTPFDEAGRLNPDALHLLMHKTVCEGASGFLIGGSSAECPLLTREERLQELRAAAAYPSRRGLKLIASVAGMSTEEAVLYAQEAANLGYDAMITTAPYFYKHSMKALAGYLRAVKQAAALPLYFYNFPGNTGVELDIQDPDIRAVFTDGTIAGIKQTSLNLFQLERLKALNPSLVCYGGFDELFLAARAMGADGAIGATFNFTLPLFTKIDQAFRAGDWQTAQALQHRANNIVSALASCSLFPAIKHMLRVQGIDCGICRAPFLPLSDDQKAYIERVVRENL